MSALRDAWQQRSPQERTLLAWGAAVLVVALVAGLGWLPLERQRARLAAELPVARASVASLERDAQEVQRLRSLPPASATLAAPLASLATNGGGLAGGSITVLDGRRVRVAGADVSFAALLDWLRNAQATHGMRVEAGRVEALPTRGRVRVELTLAKG
jgi:general secretion pathway protein M